MFSCVWNFLLGQSTFSLQVINSERALLPDAHIKVNGNKANWNDETQFYEVAGVKPPYTLEVACEGYGSFFAKNIYGPGGEVSLFREGEPYYYDGWKRYPCKDTRNALVVVFKKYDAAENRLDDKVSFQTTDSLIIALGYIATICPDSAPGCDDPIYLERMKNLRCFYLQKADHSLLDHSPAFLEQMLMATGKVAFVGIPINELLPPYTPYAVTGSLKVYFEPWVKSRRKIMRLLKNNDIVPDGMPFNEMNQGIYVAFIQLPIDYVQGMNARIERLMHLPEVADVEMSENGYLIIYE